MTPELATHRRHRLLAKVISSHAVWLPHVFSLSLRDTEPILAERSIAVTHEGVRRWRRKFGLGFAAKPRRRRPKPGDTWHLDGMFLRVDGVLHHLRRAMDRHGVVLVLLHCSRPGSGSRGTGAPGSPGRHSPRRRPTQPAPAVPTRQSPPVYAASGRVQPPPKALASARAKLTRHGLPGAPATAKPSCRGGMDE